MLQEVVYEVQKSKVFRYKLDTQNPKWLILRKGDNTLNLARLPIPPLRLVQILKNINVQVNGILIN